MLRLASIAALLTLVIAAPASADSIAFIKGGDVWLATPDGSRQVQVTRTGTYSYVSQADDGTMIALAPGERLHKLSRTGAVLADFTTYVSDGGPVSRFAGPFNPEISPDGSKVAFEWFNESYENEPGCSDQTVPPCYVYTQRQGVGVSSSGGYTGPEAYGLMTGWIYPHWMTNDTLLRSFSGAVFNDDAVFTPLGGEVDPWFFDDQQGFGVDDVELSRDLSTVVGIAGSSDEKLRVYRTTMHPFGAPNWNHQPFATGNVATATRCYELDGKFESTTLAPGGGAMAYGTAEGVFVATIPAGCAPGAPGTLLAAGARFPDWGPADLPPATDALPAPAEPESPAPAPATPKLGLSVKRNGKVTLTTSGPGRASVTVKLKRRTIGSARKTVKAAGKVTLRVKLKKRSRGKATVTATFKPAGGGATQSARASVKLR
jgi:hypothetical protein